MDPLGCTVPACGTLAPDSGKPARLWSSAAAFIRSVADELFIHTKTLLFRKHRIEEILGESLEDPAIRMNLALALQLHELNRR